MKVIFNNDTPLAPTAGLPVPNDQDGVSPYTQNGVERWRLHLRVHRRRSDDRQYQRAHAQPDLVPNGTVGALRENPIPYGKTISGITIPEDLEPTVDIPMVHDAGVMRLTLNGKSFRQPSDGPPGG